MADTQNVERLDNGDGSKKFYSAKSYMDLRGVVDFGNLIQFAPYESGYCFLVVINGPAMMANTSMNDHRKDLQDAFIKILEQEFKGLSGIEDITSDTMEITDNITTMSLISKVVQNTNSQITMSFTEKSGMIITKYISTFLRFIKDPRTQAKHYGGLIGYGDGQLNPIENPPGFNMEVFNMLYIVTDSTCLVVEKAFLMLNMQPTQVSYGDMFDMEKGSIENKQVNVNFNAFVVDGKVPNTIAQTYLTELVNTSESYASGKINVNSWNYNWSFANGEGNIKKSRDLTKVVNDSNDVTRGAYITTEEKKTN